MYALTNYCNPKISIVYFGFYKLHLCSLIQKIYQLFKGRAYFFEYVNGKMYRLCNSSLPRGCTIYYLPCDDSVGAKCTCKLGCIKRLPIPAELHRHVKSFLIPLTP